MFRKNVLQLFSFSSWRLGILFLWKVGTHPSDSTGMRTSCLGKKLLKHLSNLRLKSPGVPHSLLGKRLNNLKLLKKTLYWRVTWYQILSCDLHILLQKFGKPVEPNDWRMSGERCAYLCAVAIANKLNEAWMSLLPYIPLYYLIVYYPNVGN